MTMDFGLSEVNCCSLYQALKIIEKEFMIIPHLIHRSSNFQRFLESPPISARWNFLVHFGGPPRVVPFRDAISVGCYEICGCCDIAKWCQDMTWIIDEDWSRSVLCDTFCGSCIEMETHGCTIHACNATVWFSLIQSWLRESLPLTMQNSSCIHLVLIFA